MTTFCFALHAHRPTHPVWFHVELTWKAQCIFTTTLVKVDLWSVCDTWFFTYCTVSRKHWILKILKKRQDKETIEVIKIADKKSLKTRQRLDKSITFPVLQWIRDCSQGALYNVRELKLESRAHFQSQKCNKWDNNLPWKLGL